MRYNSGINEYGQAVLETLLTRHKGVISVEPHDSTKACARCKHVLPISAFNKCTANHDGLQNYCRACQKAKSNAYYWSDPEGQRQRVAAYREANPEKYLDSARRSYRKTYFKGRYAETKRQWTLANAERVKELRKATYWRIRDEAIRKAGEWAASNPERANANKNRWLKRHPLKAREFKHRRRARERATMIGPIDFKAIYHRDKGICHICLNPVPQNRLHYDHVIPLSKGGPHTMENLKVSHARCNLKKGAKT